MISRQSPPAPTSVHGLVARWVRRTPTACAVTESESGRSLTYEELWRHAGWLAAELAGAPRRLVAAAASPSVDLAVALLGILRAGAAYVPLDPHAPADRLAAILHEAGDPPVVVAAGEPGDRWADRLAGHPVVRVPAGGGSAVDGEAGADSPAYVSFTSGSTGRPKGVVVPHRAVARLVLEPNYCTISPGDRVANMANPAFDATTFELWSTLTAGGTVVVLPTPAELPVDEWIARIAGAAVDTMFLTTSMFHTIARERPGAFATLANLVVGGEQLDLAVSRRVLAGKPPGRLVNGYGPTETTTFAAAYECTEESLRGMAKVPIGYPLQRTELLVLDERLTPVTPGEVGELCVGGPGVALGYLGQPELTARRFVEWAGRTIYRTGDLVRELPGGALEVVGRSDRQVKVRGFRIELEEIEHATAATGLVEAVFVEKVGEGPNAALVGFVLPAGAAGAADHDGLAAVLRTRLAETLPGYMVPARWVPLDAVPLGPTGKADRTAMLAMLAAPAPPAAPDSTGPAEPARQAELAVVGQVVAEVLGVDGVAASDNFLDLGGNSILAVRIASRIGARLAVDVDPTELLLAETLAEFAGTLASEAVAGA
ncbi:non-ribosomal peptide synthetase [Actinophytocola sp.]|uniref:non-ribosomal peptide synthetase n=1 Tax=Actinophytocola sp. TaxID=1872138 RepID=UPI002D2FED7B|nr:non-ribosomal peptide synthetase [Actinophytocola sp.]HYQ69462.1 non-ribosomal peptide synthetase [Actinophytocola sp.]